MLSPEAMSESVLPPRVMPVSKVLLHLGSVSMSMTVLIAKGHTDVHGLCCRLKPYDVYHVSDLHCHLRP